ncbi:MAG: YgiT-type zinc finger protein [Acidobacteriota bacterium]|nr:YgiT-type zinc finger protein [Acidobacteriota bacterium]
MERGAAPFHVDRNGYHLVLDRIAAWVCGQCGEYILRNQKSTPFSPLSKLLMPR